MNPASVAQPSSELLKQNENNPQYYKEKENQLLLLYNENNLETGRAREIELFSRFEKISGRQNNSFKALTYFYQNGCSFAKDLEKNLGITVPTSHTVIKRLVEAGFIEPLTKTDIPRKDGPKTTLYGVLDVTNSEIDKAISRNMKVSNKRYVFVEKLYQRTLVEIERESIQYHKIISLAKKQGGNGFHFMDIAKQVANIHQEKGVKVWQ